MQYDSNIYIDVSLFKSHLVYKIKGKVTDKPYKKFCFVIQVYDNIKKTALLTQTSTI